MPKVNVTVAYDCQDQIDDFGNSLARLCNMGCTGKTNADQLREIKHLSSCLEQAIQMAFRAGRDYETKKHHEAANAR